MEYNVLLFLHILSAIVWAGGVITLSFFIVPSVLEAGPAGGAVMANVTKRRMPTVLITSAIVVILTGLRLYMMRFVPSWLATPQGIVLTLGAILGLGGFAIGVFVQRPLVDRLSALAMKVASSGAPPSPAQAAELQSMRDRLRRMARITGFHLLGAATLMAIHRLAATM
jgi:putative copper export protein